MILRTSLLLQSLMVGMWPPDENLSRESKENALGVGLDSEEEWWGAAPIKLSPIPDPRDYAKMARFIVHNANWTSIAYISNQKGTEGRALADMLAVSDGPLEAGFGVPYFYVSRLEAVVSDLLDNDNQCSLTMGLSQTPFCKERDWDDEDPRCAHVVLTGTFQRLDTKDPEFRTAQKALFSRHPSFRNLPPSHHFFIAKYAIETITLQDNFGGPVAVPVSDYFAVKDESLMLDTYMQPRYEFYLFD